MGTVTARLSQDRLYPWPPRPEIVGSPAARANSDTSTVSHQENIASATPAPKLAPEPDAPSRADLKKESLRTGDDLAGEDMRSMLLDEKRSATVKLALIDKLRTQPAEQVVPVLLAFLEGPGGPSAAYTKPTAIKVLKGLKDPLAEEALAKLARTSQDERVRVTIASLGAKETSR